MKLRIISILLLTSIALINCERNLTTEGISRVTTFAVITMNGNNPMFINVGDDYDEPGATTSTGDPVTISGSVDASTPGVYTVYYSATNKDGFSASVTRTVYVSNKGDFVNSIEGLYTSDVTRVSPPETHEDLEYVRIWSTGNPNEYGLSHGLGGFYALGRGYGDTYAGQGAVLTIDFGTNTGTATGGSVPGWGLPFTITDVVIDPAEKTVSFTSDFFGAYIFNTVLTQYDFEVGK